MSSGRKVEAAIEKRDNSMCHPAGDLSEAGLHTSRTCAASCRQSREQHGRKEPQKTTANEPTFHCTITARYAHHALPSH